MTTLSDLTKVAYEGNLRIMHNAKLNLFDHEATLKWILENKKTENTQKNYIAAAVAFVKANEDARKETALAAYRKKMTELAKVNLSRYEDQAFTEREEKKYVKWADIQKGVEAAYADSDCLDSDKLLLGFYTEMSPLRLDYGNLAVFANTVPEGTKGNYIVLKATGSQVIINDHKESKIYGAIKKDLPASLDRRLALYIAGNPETKVLFPYDEKALSKRLVRLFRKYCGRDVGCCMLRHSYITHFLASGPSYRKCQELAKSMGHSVQLQTFYRRLPRESES